MLDVLTPCLREKQDRRPVFILRERECRKKRNGAETDGGLRFCTERRRNVEEREEYINPFFTDQ